MVEKYRELMLQIAPPIILLDMDGALVDWDSGFRAKWADRSTIDRTKSYYMQLCVDEAFYREAELLMYTYIYIYIYMYVCMYIYIFVYEYICI
jgi:hypothetical protein